MRGERDLSITKKLVYDKYGFQMTSFRIEDESQEYGACRFELNGLGIIFRTGKITPAKSGQFVTIWKRHKGGPIQPFESTDPFDIFVVNVRSGEKHGQFIFPKSILIKKNIISKTGKGGKRAVRIYPPWDKTLNKQAKKTQSWQLNYFLAIDKNINLKKLKKLYSLSEQN